MLPSVCNKLSIAQGPVKAGDLYDLQKAAHGCGKPLQWSRGTERTLWSLVRPGVMWCGLGLRVCSHRMCRITRHDIGGF